jgi:hypothetical protein
MNDSSISMVRAWVDAINDRNANRLSELSSSDMKFTGTRGSGHGIKLVLDWLARVGLTLHPKRIFAGSNTVVVEIHGVWRSVETGEFIGEEDEGWRFKIEDKLVVAVERFDELKTALTAAELKESDETEAV